jgi:hypothetical protein
LPGAGRGGCDASLCSAATTNLESRPQQTKAAILMNALQDNFVFKTFSNFFDACVLSQLVEAPIFRSGSEQFHSRFPAGNAVTVPGRFEK